MGGSDMRIGFRAVQGVQIRFAVSDSPTSPRLVLTSPWPESLLAFQRVWPRLSRTAHLLAVDLPGFGHSERRTELLGDRFARATRYVRSYPEQLQRLGHVLPTIYTPVQIIAGRWDPLVPLANADYLHARLPNSRLDILDTGHFAWEEAPEQYAAIVTAWVNGGYLTGSAGHQW